MNNLNGYIVKRVLELKENDIIGLPAGTTLIPLNNQKIQEVGSIIPYKVLSRTDNKFSGTITLELEYSPISDDLYKEFELQKVVAKIMNPIEPMILLVDSNVKTEAIEEVTNESEECVN